MLLQKRISNYFNYVVEKGINLKAGDAVEIVTSSYIDITPLKKCLLRHNVSEIVITYIDGYDIEKEINKDWRAFLDKRINKYNSLIERKFSRITILSPFLCPVTRTTNVDLYKAHLNELSFVHSYFYNLNSPSTIIPIPNINWAIRLNLTMDKLWERILAIYEIDNNLFELRNKLLSLELKALEFKTGLGTDLRVGLIEKSTIISPKWIAKDGRCFYPNLPSRELYTSPNKYKVDGIVVGSRPLYYNGEVINSFTLELRAGLIINNKGLDKILALDSSLLRVGEIAIVLPHDDIVYNNTLMDENLGCHLALGQGFSNIIKSPLVNKGKHHIDLVFGTDDIRVYGILSDGSRITIIENKKFGGKLC